MSKIIAELRRLDVNLEAAVDALSFEIDNDPVFHVSLDNANGDFDDQKVSTASPYRSARPSIIDWFWNECKTVSSQQDQGSLDGNQIGSMILDVLKKPGPVEEAQVALVEIVGFDHLDFIADLLSRQTELIRAMEELGGDHASSHNEDADSAGMSEAAQAQWKRQNRLKAAERNANLAMSSMTDPKYPHVYRQRQQTSALTLTNVKRVLPEGSVRESLQNYELVRIPAQIPDKKFHPKNMLPIADLDELCRVTFSKYETLNNIQTLVYPICYETNENMLICAPTGAGKTDVALLSILSTVKSVKDSADPWKIVYVAPLKALAAEITEKLGSRLAWLGVKVRELTGDMQLTRREIEATHVLVTTPEKWDVVTRKPNDDSGVANQIRLLIIDEVHLLHEERGAVLESIVARTRRQVEARQSMIRIVGLSATLPNFVDVAEFLGVNLQRGLFYFDATFRPVPLEQQFYGVRAPRNNPRVLNKNLDKVAYDECVAQLRKGHSVMIFVHSRRETTKTAQSFIDMAQQDGISDLFVGENADSFSRDMRQFSNRGMLDLYQGGFATHHAGMARSERNMSERLFANGGVRVLCSTATLAWGVNLPAAVVIIKGTQVYDAQRGGFVDLGISDVIQIFGRAGRPQFKQTGLGVLCTSADKLDHYIDAITNQHPIESRFARKLPENLNAEIALGTVSTLNEAVQWLGYTYMFVRMRKAPQIYGLLPRNIADDPALVLHRRKLIVDACRLLRDTQLIVFDDDDSTESLIAKDFGRIASEFYLLQSTVEQFNEHMSPTSSEQQLVSLLSKGGDFEGLKIRAEETAELENVSKTVPFNVDLSESSGKTSLLLQAWILRLRIEDTALSSDMAYVAQNSARILRAFFLLCLSRGWAQAAYSALLLDCALARRQWPDSAHPLLQIDDPPNPVSRRLIASKMRAEDLKTLSNGELGDLIHNQGWGPRLAQMVARFPVPTILTAQARPLTSRVVKVDVEAMLLQPFRFDHKLHGGSLHFWLLVHGSSQLLYVDKMVINSQNASDVQKFEFVVPHVTDERQVIVQLVSDAYLGAETTATIYFGGLTLPVNQSVRTDLLRLRLLSVHAWKNPILEAHYSKRFQHFNPMQTMVFHSLYYRTNESVLLGSPTGSGKTIASEVAIWAALRDRPNSKVVYIAPMKALVKERVGDWKRGICQVPFLPGKKKPMLVELTGDTQPTGAEIKNASLVITTPEKYDGVSRHHSWAIDDVSLVIMDEVHLLASDRGAILEIIVSRLNRSKSKVRLLGMSTAVANAGDLASWLGVKTNMGLFNFPSSVRPVPLEMYIDGFPDVHGGFCPLMKSMNKPAYLAICRHSANKPALVFVPSRRQTRLTAYDLMSLRAADDNSAMKTWMHMTEAELDSVLPKVKDETLKHTLQFGIAIHHAGLEYSDRQISHDLFSRGKVQILVATSTLAWGVNLPAYLVIVKGTEFFDAKLNKYKDMDLTDVLQMMGRAGRPAYDSSGVAVVFTKQSTKQFYKYFLNLGFPVESSLHKKNVLENHLGAEISAGRVKSMADALEFLTHTFLFRRIHSNQYYYTEPRDKADEAQKPEIDAEENHEEHESNEEEELSEEVKPNAWLVQRVETVLAELKASRCLTETSSGFSMVPTPFLLISSFYYISHLTMRMFLTRISSTTEPKGVLQCLALATEYDELAIRHNEDICNTELSRQIEFPGEELGLRMVDPHVKAYVLVQARMRRLSMPVEDYIQDTITVLDQAVRILQALLDTAAQIGSLAATMAIIQVLRNMKQGIEAEADSMLHILPGLKNASTPEGLTLANISAKSMERLKVGRKSQSSLQKTIESLPRVNIHGEKAEAEISPSTRPVYCPMFHKPQRESWFVIRTENKKVTSLERIQRKHVVKASPGQHVYIMNDTLAIDYELHAAE